jgi:hypothetical protein
MLIKYVDDKNAVARVNSGHLVKVIEYSNKGVIVTLEAPDGTEISRLLLRYDAVVERL